MQTPQETTDSKGQNPAESIRRALIIARKRIREAEAKYGRKENSVTLLAVSKTKPVEDILAAIAAEQTEFGENYLDEALSKQTALSERNLNWHYIGGIQSNKTAALASQFDWVHGVDREKIAQRLSVQRPPTLAPLNCCIQVNIDREETKSGVLPEQVPELAAFMQTLVNIKLRGLMVIPAATEGFESQRQSFARVRELFESLQIDHPSLDTLSMGMSSDIEAAIAEGSTLVRIGTAIFGARAAKA